MVITEIFWNNKKIILFTPVFHEISFKTDFKEKEDFFFNSIFANQCSLIKNTNELPDNLTFHTDNRLSTISFFTGGHR